MITASGLPRIERCPPSAVLPQAKEETADTTRGIAVHHFLEEVPKLGLNAAYERVPDEYRAICDALPVDRLPLDPNAYAAEVAFAYDAATDTARELGRGTKRDYTKLAPGEIAGTADVVALAPDHVLIIDYKSGWNSATITPAAKNMQLHFLALAAARAYGKDKAVVMLMHLRDTGAVWADTAELDVFDLDLIASRVGATLVRVLEAKTAIIAGEVPTTTSGPHCRHCPAFVSCPSITSLLRVMVSAPEDVGRELQSLITPATAADAVDRLRLVELVIKKARESVYAYAARTPIPLNNGMVLGPVEVARDEVDGAAAHHVLAEVYGRDVADAACAFDSSKAAIKRALVPVAKTRGMPAAQLEREAMDHLQRAGAIVKKRSVSIKEHRADDGALKLTAGD